MINAMTISAKTKGEVNVMNGYAHRPILSTNDLVRSIETIVNSNEDKRGVYNLASVNHNILDIGNKVAKHNNVPLVDKGNNFTYDFSINSEKFMKEFNFEFNDTVETIVDNILSNPHNDKWQKRDTK